MTAEIITPRPRPSPRLEHEAKVQGIVVSIAGLAGELARIEPDRWAYWIGTVLREVAEAQRGWQYQRVTTRPVLRGRPFSIGGGSVRYAIMPVPR